MCTLVQTQCPVMCTVSHTHHSVMPTVLHMAFCYVHTGSNTVSCYVHCFTHTSFRYTHFFAHGVLLCVQFPADCSVMFTVSRTVSHCVYCFTGGVPLRAHVFCTQCPVICALLHTHSVLLYTLSHTRCSSRYILAHYTFQYVWNYTFPAFHIDSLSQQFCCCVTPTCAWDHLYFPCSANVTCTTCYFHYGISFGADLDC